MRVQDKETLKAVLLRSGMVVCLFLAGCRNKSVDRHNRGVDHLKKAQYDQAVSDSDYNKALEIKPRYAKAHSNRAVAYYIKGESDEAWADLHEVQSLELQVAPELQKNLSEASRRER